MILLTDLTGLTLIMHQTMYTHISVLQMRNRKPVMKPGANTEINPEIKLAIKKKRVSKWFLRPLTFPAGILKNTI